MHFLLLPSAITMKKIYPTHLSRRMRDAQNQMALSYGQRPPESFQVREQPWPKSVEAPS